MEETPYLIFTSIQHPIKTCQRNFAHGPAIRSARRSVAGSAWSRAGCDQIPATPQTSSEIGFVSHGRPPVVQSAMRNQQSPAPGAGWLCFTQHHGVGRAVPTVRPAGPVALFRMFAPSVETQHFASPCIECAGPVDTSETQDIASLQEWPPTRRGVGFVSHGRSPAYALTGTLKRSRLASVGFVSHGRISRVCPYGQTKTVPTGLRWLCFARLGDVLSHSTTKGLQPGVGFVSQNQSRSQR